MSDTKVESVVKGFTLGNIVLIVCVRVNNYTSGVYLKMFFDYNCDPTFQIDWAGF